jgi:hypothetical protein
MAVGQPLGDAASAGQKSARDGAGAHVKLGARRRDDDRRRSSSDFGVHFGLAAAEARAWRFCGRVAKQPSSISRR